MLIMDNDGNRILAKYYDKNVFPTVKEQKQYEKNLFNKTHRANAEIIMLDGLTVVYKSNVDLFFYVMGGKQENELILLSVLNCLFDTISLLLKKNVEKRALMDNLDVVMLAFDEICDGGWVSQTDCVCSQLTRNNKWIFQDHSWCRPVQRSETCRFAQRRTAAWRTNSRTGNKCASWIILVVELIPYVGLTNLVNHPNISIF